MNIRDLKYVIEIAKERNFARAAENSFVSQPALSMQIKKLEDELGVQIFERDKKNFLITEVGKKIIEKAKIILQESEEIKSIAQNSRDPFSGEFRVGAFPTLASYFFPEILPKISKKFPKLKTLLVEEKTDDLIAKLKEGKIDAAFLAMPISEENLDSIKIFEEPFLLAVPKNHELTKKQKVQTKDLKKKEVMLLEDGHCLREQALEACAMFGASEQSYKASSLETLRQMIAIGNGITFIPKIAIRDIDKKDQKISYLQITNAPSRKIGLYFRKTSVKKELITQLTKAIKKGL